jgi:predicted outer membrane repeat protein
VSAIFVGCTIEGNATAGPAGACYLNNNATSFTRCRILGNQAGQHGGAIYTDNGSLTFIGCLIAGNFAQQNSGAMRINLQSAQSLLIKNCTIVANTAGFANGGINVNQSSTLVTVQNSIVWGNSGTNLEAAAASVIYSDVGFGWYTASVGTFNLDPLFIDSTNGDYHLSHSSPCRDYGAPGTTGLPLIDLDGAPRIVNGIVDIGSDEVPMFAYPGTNDDLEIDCWVDDGGDPLASTRPGALGAHLRFLFQSPGGTLVGAPPVVAGVLFPNGSPPAAVPGFPQIWLSGNLFIIAGSLGAPPFTIPGLPSNGITLEYLIPSGLSGNTVRIQAMVLSPLTNNFTYAATNATEVVL